MRIWLCISSSYSKKSSLACRLSNDFEDGFRKSIFSWFFWLFWLAGNRPSLALCDRSAASDSPLDSPLCRPSLFFFSLSIPLFPYALSVFLPRRRHFENLEKKRRESRRERFCPGSHWSRSRSCFIIFILANLRLQKKGTYFLPNFLNFFEILH